MKPEIESDFFCDRYIRTEDDTSVIVFIMLMEFFKISIKFRHAIV